MFLVLSPGTVVPPPLLRKSRRKSKCVAQTQGRSLQVMALFCALTVASMAKPRKLSSSIVLGRMKIKVPTLVMGFVAVAAFPSGANCASAHSLRDSSNPDP